MWRFQARFGAAIHSFNMKKRKILWILFLLFFPWQTVNSQKSFDRQSVLLTRFSFREFPGGTMIIKARLNGFTDTLRFIFDTGSSGVSLDSSTALRLGMSPIPSDKFIFGVAGKTKALFLNNLSLILPGLQIDSLDFHVNDYGILSNSSGEHIDGIVGYPVINRFIIKVDRDSSYLEFWTTGNFNYPEDGFILQAGQFNTPIINASVKDNAMINSKFFLDLGAGLNMILSNTFVEENNFLSKKSRYFRVQLEGLGGKINMSATVIKEIKIGQYNFFFVPVYIFRDTNNITCYPSLSGLIGSDLMRRFNLILNYSRKEIWAIPNTYFRDPFDYTYTGMELYSINGKILIEGVIEDSPADRAGVKEGDIVLAVNNHEVQDLRSVKNSIQNTQNKLRLRLQRNGRNIEIRFKVASMVR
jgi:hypothetical protein